MFEKPHLGLPNEISSKYVEKVIEDWKAYWHVLKHREEQYQEFNELLRVDIRAREQHNRNWIVCCNEEVEASSSDEDP